MKLYHVTFTGHYVGGHLIIIAKDSKHARELAEPQIASEHVSEENSKIIKVKLLCHLHDPNPICFMIDNGDY